MYPQNKYLMRGGVFYFKCIGPRAQLERAWNILKYDSRLMCILLTNSPSTALAALLNERAVAKVNVTPDAIKRFKRSRL